MNYRANLKEEKRSTTFNIDKTKNKHKNKLTSGISFSSAFTGPLLVLLVAISTFFIQ